MRYRIEIDKPAMKFIKQQTKKQQERILKAIAGLPLAGDIKPLRGLSDTFRLRVGDYRIVYTIQNEKLLVLVMSAGNRGDIYK